MRDFYDLHLLYQLYEKNIDFNVLSNAINNTCQKRNSSYVFKSFNEICDSLIESKIMQKQWDIYQKEYCYAESITWPIIIKSLKEVLLKLTTI